MKQLSELLDPTYQQPASYSRYEKFWLKYINDKRDFPFIHLLTWIHISVIPLGLLLFFPVLQGAWWWVVYAVWFFIGHIKLRGPFGLMLHNITHRRLFKKKYDWLNKYVIWFVCPFFGHTPETYFVHHVGMHHEENNMDDDTSSTLPYQRDSVTDFFKYYLNFIFLGFKETFMYFIEEIPADLEEVARVHGMGQFEAFVKVTLPLIRGELLATALFVFILNWSEFLFALTLTSGHVVTVTLQVANYVSASSGKLYGVQAAMGTISTIPVIVFGFLIQSHLVRGLTLGAVRG